MAALFCNEEGMEASKLHLLTIAGVLAILCTILSVSSVPATALEHPITSEGLVDLKGREIIPCRFDWVRADNDGLFCCYEKRAPGSVGGIWTRVYNKDGKELLKSAQGILKVVILHDVPEGTVLGKLPADTVILAFSPRGRTLLSLNGKEIIAPQKEGISIVRAAEYMIFAPKGDGIDYGAAKTVFIYDTVKGEAVGEPWRIKEVCEKWLLPDNTTFPIPSGIEEDGISIINTGAPTGKALCYLFDGKRRMSSARFVTISDAHDGLRIVGRRSDSSPTKYGIIRYGIVDAKFKYRVLPEYSEMQYLNNNRYFAQKETGSAYELIDGNGKKLGELPEGTYEANVGGDLILCKRHVGSGESRRAVISVVAPDGKVLCTQDNYGGGDCRDGIALLVEQGASLKEIGYTVVTGEGVVAHGVKGYKLTPTKQQCLIKTVFVRYTSAGKN